MEQDLLAALQAAARDAGRIIMRHRAEGVVAERKADRSVVTAADREAEALILGVLSQVAPEVVVVAEEASSVGRQPVAAKTFFLVDPLDGTKEFLSNGRDFTVNIALIEDGAPVLGVVYVPAEETMWWGSAQGAYRSHWPIEAEQGIPVRIACSKCSDSPRAVASKSHSTPATEAYLAHCKAGDRLSIGSSLKFLLLADGQADLYPRAGPTMEWDTAAGDAVLRAAGGMTFNMEGARLAYGKPDYFNAGFVATGGHRSASLASFYPDHQTKPGVH